MATRKSVSKSKLKPVKAKVSKAVPAKKVTRMPAPVSQATKDLGAVVAVPVKQKVKLVRDSFTMPKNEYHTLSDLKLRGARLGLPAKKSEILRAGVAVLNKMSDKEFAIALAVIPGLKTRRPKASKKDGAKKATKKA